MSSLEGLGFVSLYKAFLSPFQYLFSSLLLIRVENFLSTALVWLNLHNTGEKYTRDKITFSIYVENYIQYSCLKRITLWCGQHSVLSLKRRQSAILFYFLKKLDVVGKTIRDFMLWNSPGGENPQIPLGTNSPMLYQEHPVASNPTTCLSNFDGRKKVNMME